MLYMWYFTSSLVIQMKSSGNWLGNRKIKQDNSLGPENEHAWNQEPIAQHLLMTLFQSFG